MFVAVDVGNSHVHVGLALTDVAPWSRTLRFASDPARTSDEWHALLSPYLQPGESRSLTRVVMSSVVPSLTTNLRAYFTRYLGVTPLVTRHDLNLGITVATDNPAETGSDRIVNAAAAVRLVDPPLVIVDLGTASKVDAVDGDKRFLGGAIAPGLGTNMTSLTARAARLYAVPVELPVHAIGTNTIAAVQSGVVLGHLLMIEGLVQQVAAELGGEPPVILTGGYGHLLAGSSPRLPRHEANLTLDGLRVVSQLNP